MLGIANHFLFHSYSHLGIYHGHDAGDIDAHAINLTSRRPKMRGAWPRGHFLLGPKRGVDDITPTITRCAYLDGENRIRMFKKMK